MRQLSHSLCADVLNTVGPHVQSDVYNTLYVYLLFLCRIYMDRGYSPLSEDLDELDMRLNALPSSSFSLPNGLFPYDHLTGWKKPSL